jgi:apolipoprotein N-acyltransferase
LRVLLPVALIWLAGFALDRVNWVSPTDRVITASLLQGNISQDMKWLPELQGPTIELYQDMSRRNWNSDLIVWPETALPDFYHRAEDLIESFGEQARANQTDILLGVLYFDQEERRYYNSMVSLAESPRFYHKQHLVPFTEYLPLKWLLGGLVEFMQVPMSDFTAGVKGQPLLEGAGYKIGISICFEDAFGEEVIWTLPEAALLVNVSNDGWFAGSKASRQHLQMAQMRAIETGRPMLRATNTGVTAAFDHKGELIGSIPEYEVGVLTVEVQPMQGATPYAKVGNVLVISLAILALVFAGVINRRFSSSPSSLRAI